jgi:hypothetical protein
MIYDRYSSYVNHCCYLNRPQGFPENSLSFNFLGRCLLLDILDPRAADFSKYKNCAKGEFRKIFRRFLCSGSTGIVHRSFWLHILLFDRKTLDSFSAEKYCRKKVSSQSRRQNLKKPKVCRH